MLIDCGTCVARDIACADCVVTVLLAGPPGPVELDTPTARVEFDAAAGAEFDAAPGAESDTRPATLDFDEVEWAAVGRLAEAGLVPPLRLVRPLAGGEPHESDPRMPETA